MSFTDEVYESFKYKKSLISLFLDFSKAFGTVDHSNLLKKLKYCGIRGEMLKWYKTNLSDCCQNYQCPIFRRVLHGSIFEPLLFIIYIIDLNKCTSMNVVHYTDDSTEYMIGYSFDSLIRKTNFELGKIDNWLCANKLSLNISKSQFGMLAIFITIIVVLCK